MSLLQYLHRQMKPVRQESGEVDPEQQHQRQMEEHRDIGGCQRFLRRWNQPRHHRLHLSKQGGKRHRQPEQQQGRQVRRILHRGGQDQEFTGEDPEGRHPRQRHPPQKHPPADRRIAPDQAADMGHLLGAVHLGGVADAEERGRLGQTVDDHMQHPAEGGDRPAKAEGKGGDPHMLDGGVGEEALDVLLAQHREGRRQQGEEAEPHHDVAGKPGAEGTVNQRLAADQGVQRDVQQQAGEHGRNRRRPLAVGIGEPVVQRYQTGFRAVADHQEDKGEAHDGRVELAADPAQVGPEQRVPPRPQHPFGGEVEQHRAEERLGDPDAAEDEILPGRLDCRRGPVERHQEDGRQRRQLHRDPEHPEIVGHQRDQHREDEELEHRVIKTHPPRADPAMFPLDPHVAAAEDGGRGGNQGGQDDQGDIQVIDKEVGRAGNAPPFAVELQRQQQRHDEGQSRAADVDLRCVAPVADKGQDQRHQNRYAEEGEKNHRLIRLLELGHLINTQTVKGGVDLKEEDAEDEGRDQQVERHPQLHHHRHAVGGAGGGKKQAVLHRQKAQDLRHGMAAGHHHQQPEHDRCQRHRQGGTGHQVGELPDRRGQVIAEDHQHNPEQHRGRNIDDRLDITVDLQLVYQLVEDVGEQKDLHPERQERRDVEVVFTAGKTDHGGAERQKKALPGKDMDQPHDLALGQQRKGGEQNQGRQQAVYLGCNGMGHHVTPG